MNFFSRLTFSLVTLISFAILPLSSYARVTAPENCETRPFDKGRLWKVTIENVVPSYIFGTMHSKDPRILHLPGAIMQAFMGSDTAIFETSLKNDELAASRDLMMLPTGKSLKAVIGEDRFAELVVLAAPYGMNAATLDRFKIWAAAAIISQPPPSHQQGAHPLTLLDKELEKSAYQSGKKVVALESNREQLDIFNGMPEAVQLEYLDQSMMENKELDAELETITSYYLSGNTGWIACDLEEALNHASPELNKIMTTELIEERNRRMVKRMVPELEKGNAFVGVGALHLPGTVGVLSLLKERGYSIERKY